MELTPPLITALFAGLNGILSALLAITVTVARAKEKTPFGDGGNLTVTKVMRRHANNAEYVPLALIIIALVEMTGGIVWSIWAFGGVLFAARLFHAAQFVSENPASPGRIVGTTATWLVIILSGLYAIYITATAL